MEFLSPRGKAGRNVLSISIALSCLVLTAVVVSGLASGHGTVSHTAQAQDALPQITPTVVCGPTWTILHSPNTFPSRPNYLRGVAALNTYDVWAVGHIGDPFSAPWTLVEHWNGNEWSIVSSPTPGGIGLLLGVAAISPDDVWAVGYSTTNMLIEHWNGTDWVVVAIPSIPGTDSRLYAISALSANDVWAVGTYVSPTHVTRTLTIHWDGSAWTTIPSPNIGSVSNELHGVSALSSNDVWAVGSMFYNNNPLTFHWDGYQWTIVPNPTTPIGEYSPYRLSAVDAIAPNDVWAVGVYHTTSSYTRPLIEHWDGSQWSIVSTPYVSPNLFNELISVVAIASNDVWAVGSYDIGLSYTMTQHWDGSSWRIVPSANRAPDPNAYDNYLSGVAATDQGHLYAVGYVLQGSIGYTFVERYMDQCATPVPTSTPTPCIPGNFSDVPSTNTFYPYITCLVNRGIVSGYGDCTFRPNNEVTRGQLAKIVSNAAAFTESPDPQIFEDVSSSNTFYQWINRLSRRGHMSGYVCGGAGEPCASGMPYFRPFADATRGQTSKIVSNAAGYTEIPTEQTFEDVSPSHTFYREIQRLATRNIMQGYPCGGVGEPCITGKPYFRPANNVTRGQSAKIVANTFFPGCQSAKP